MLNLQRNLTDTQLNLPKFILCTCKMAKAPAVLLPYEVK